MLKTTFTKKGTGIRIIGEREELDLLYSIIHELADGLDESRQNQSGQFKVLMNFAYEVRKAAEGSRDIEESQNGLELRGFRCIWPDILIFSSTLRNVAGYIQTSSLVQSQLYYLEYLIDLSMQDYDPNGAMLIHDLVFQRIPTSAPFIFQAYQKIHLSFLDESPGKKRFRRLSHLIRNFVYEHSPGYSSMVNEIESYAKENDCKPMDVSYEENREIQW